ncbi:MAG: gamma carbonic anhydrase family protein [Dehalococcoidia bacterium]|nr:gamma carbonic anhydrase family protein [Dehalococcoidia bacterium]
MPIFAVGDKVPRIHPTAFIAPTATVVGDVDIHEGASIWYGAVVRGDTGSVVIGAGANVQDGAVVHSRFGQPALIGEGATLAHNCIVHAANIGARAMVANGAQVLDGASVGEGALVAAGSVVLTDGQVPAGMLAVGIPAQVKRPVAGTPAGEWVANNPLGYARLAVEHRDGLRELARAEVKAPDPMP